MSATVIVPAMQISGLGMMLYGWQASEPVTGMLGVVIAVVGGLIWKMKTPA